MKKSKPVRAPRQKPPAGSPAPAGERIAKVIARAGLCSRRDAERWIEAGRVTVNGQTLDRAAVNVGAGDRIEVDGKILPQIEPARLWRHHKKKGLVNHHKDPEGRPTVFNALPADMPRIISVGRLNLNTEGLLLLTNDGALARLLELPSTGWLRRYRVRAHGEVDPAALEKLRNGIEVGGVRYGPIEARLDRKQGRNCWLTMALREGKNREIKRVLEHLDLTVNRLIRTSYGPFMLGELAPGTTGEIKPRVLREQLGERLAQEAGVHMPQPRQKARGRQRRRD